MSTVKPDSSKGVKRNGSLGVAVIIPAYNEEERIGVVLEVIYRSPLVDEIIVVDDGSVDRTAEAARRHGVRVIHCGRNMGKGAALQAGIESTDAEILLFIDADLVGLTEEHVRDLVEPLLEDHELVMTVGKFVGGRLRTDLSQILIPSISGQRALRRSFLNGLPDLSTLRFGVEVAITRHAKRNGMKVREVMMSDATHVMKEEKLGLLRGIAARARMYADMIRHLVFDRPRN